jgi:uncharacterized protein YhaN
MRISKLDLLAYGPFRGLSLDLAAPGLHLVFGRNEAGKSTTLRAITGLLYGIDVRTRDAHAHKPTDLRIGGTLIGDGGEVVRLVRRKGNANTLLDDRGQPIDDAVLLRHLRGVGRETFEHAFGLDHVTLREGAKALLDGKGDLGESLFDASVGGGGDVQRLVAELDEEADALYSPRGKTPPLNEALKAFTEAQKTIRDTETLPAAHVTQQRALEETTAVRDEKVREKSDLARRRALVDAARKRVPLERRRATLEAERKALAADDARAPAIDALVRRIPDLERALEEQRRLAAERIRVEARVEEAARRAGVDVSAVREAMRLDAPKEARIHRLAADREKLDDRIANAKAEIDRLERAKERLASASPSGATVDTSAIARALERVRALGDLEARIASDRAKLERRRRDLETKAAALGGHAHALDALCALDLPSVADVDAIAKRGDAAERAVVRGEGELETTARALDELEAQIKENEGDFAPPDAAELRRLRALRDERWTTLRAAKTPIERMAAEGSFETTLREGDAVVDRMLADADRVTALGRLKARREHLFASKAKLEADVAALRAARAAVDEDLRAAFAKAGIRATTAAAMRTWLVNRAALVEARASLVEEEHEIVANVARVEEAHATLASALEREPTQRLAELVVVAMARVEASEEMRRAAGEAKKQRAAIEEELETRRAALGRDEAQRAEVKTKLAELVVRLGVEPDASADEIRSVVESTSDLFHCIDERARVIAAVTAVDQEIAAFAGEVAALAPDSKPHEALESARALAKHRAHAAEIDRELATIAARLAELGTDDLPEDVATLAAEGEAAARALEDLDANIEVLDGEIKSIGEKIGGIKHGLDLMRGDSHAADAAARAQEALARVRTNAEKWVRAKLASVILRREIERYREENQGPLLGRASTLFARLTLGAFTGLRAGFDDKDRASLRIVRAGGAEIDVEALSEGTRDQLYLSLRLASLLRHAEIAAPMPLVLDDVLIHFDDERSSAALAVLAEVAKTMQVLFFTHHARLVDLAQAAIPKTELTIHELATPRPELVASPLP